MSYMISSRHKKIMTFIIETNRPITLQNIAKKLELSRRTILREMPVVYKWFEVEKYPLKHDAKLGIVFDANSEERIALLKKLKTVEANIFYTPKERRTFIVTELLQKTDSMKLFYFSSMLHVSSATISNDLDEIEVWLEKYELSLTRKQGYGIEINGDEKNKRKALVSFIHDSLNGEQIRNVISQYIQIPTNKKTIDIRKKLLDMIDINTVDVIEQAIVDSEKVMEFKFLESSYTALAVHLALAIQRLKKGEIITIGKDVLDYVKHYDEFSVAKKIAVQIEKSLSITIPIDEVAYITMHLKGAKYKSGLAESNILNFNDLMLGNYQLTVLIKQMIKIAETETKVNLSKDQSLLIGLVDHLRPAINRMQMNLDIRNPLLDKIKTNYQDIYEVSKKVVKVIEEKLNIIVPDSEIGYIALHLGSAIERIKNVSLVGKERYRVIVTCTSGIGTSKMLAERVKTEFKNVDVIKVFSTTEIDDYWLKNNQIDLIISSVHYVNKSVEVVFVNPLLFSEDIDKINYKLASIDLLSTNEKDVVQNKSAKDSIEMIGNYSNAILEVLRSFSVEQVEADSFDQLLDIVSKTKNNNSDLLKENILNREKEGSIIFDREFIVFLHTRTDSVRNLVFYIVKNKKIIKYKDKNINCATIMLAPKEATNEAIDVISEISNEMIRDEKFLSDISRLNEEELYQRIEKILRTFMIKKNHEILKSN